MEIFFHIISQAAILGRKLLNIKIVLIFSTAFVGNISQSKEN
jgi:hypothetical protein